MCIRDRYWETFNTERDVVTAFSDSLGSCEYFHVVDETNIGQRDLRSPELVYAMMKESEIDHGSVPERPTVFSSVPEPGIVPATAFNESEKQLRGAAASEAAWQSIGRGRGIDGESACGTCVTGDHEGVEVDDTADRWEPAPNYWPPSDELHPVATTFTGPPQYLRELYISYRLTISDDRWHLTLPTGIRWQIDAGFLDLMTDTPKTRSAAKQSLEAIQKLYPDNDIVIAASRS